MFDEYLGVIKALGFQFVPAQWGFCGGAITSINQFTSLFSLLGCNYGGDCRTTFALPDLRGRGPMGYGSGPGLTPRYMGQFAGWNNHALHQIHLADHSHSATYSGGAAGTPSVVHVSTSGGKQQVPASGDYIAPPGNTLGLIQDNLFLDPGDVTAKAQVSGVRGGGGEFNNNFLTIEPTPAATRSVNLMQPTMTFNYCICMEGLYPSRS